jgi:hypothetical protein
VAFLPNAVFYGGGQPLSVFERRKIEQRRFNAPRALYACGFFLLPRLAEFFAQSAGLTLPFPRAYMVGQSVIPPGVRNP